jgi:hypothetical protein
LLSNAAGRSFTDAIAFPPDQHDTYFLVFVTRLITSHSPPNAREMPLLSLSFDILVAIFQELDTRDIVRANGQFRWQPQCHERSDNDLAALR